MTAFVNLNALGGSIGNPSALQARMQAIGDCALVMDGNNMAQALKAANPASVIVHRAYNANDANWWNVVSPYAWVQSHATFGANGVIVQVGNEPVVDEGNVASFVGWNVALLTSAHAARIAVAVGGFAVGNPHENLVDGGAFDPMLKALAATDCLLVHEYFQQKPTADGERGYLCGRVEHWLKRMKAVGCKSKTVVIGEYGRDLGGGQDDGWRGQGWTPEHYAGLLIEGMENIYAPLSEQYGVKIVCMVFCAGAGFAQRWQSFNVEGEQVIYDALTNWNRKQEQAMTVIPHTQPPTAGGVLAALTAIPQTFVNVRQEPTTDAPVSGNLLVGDTVTYYANAAPGWAYVQPVTSIPRPSERLRAAAGWVALQSNAVRFTPAPTGDPPAANKAYSAQQVADMLAHLRAIEDILNHPIT